MARELKPCGTEAAYIRHLSRGETPCAPCREAHAELRRTQRGGRPRPPVQCGTRAGYRAHKRLGDAPCGDCREAHAAYYRKYRAERAS